MPPFLNSAPPSPDWWGMDGRRALGPPPVGALVPLRYAVWRVGEVRVREEADLTADDQRILAGFGPRCRSRYRPYDVVLRHVRGPVLDADAERDPDGVAVLHLGVGAGSHTRWTILPERYPVCSCHGDPWPCRAYHDDLAAAEGMTRLAHALAGSQPGVCANCLEPITARQKSVDFPEPSLLVPGAPGPRFHNRRRCWDAAYRYEAFRRLPAYPDAAPLLVPTP